MNWLLKLEVFISDLNASRSSDFYKETLQPEKILDFCVMESETNNLAIVLGVLGFISNGSTLLYILQNFNIFIHVFSLLFIDTLFSTSCALLSLILDVLVRTEVLQQSFTYCTMSFLALYLPAFYGPVLTFLVAVTRYILTKKSARNIQVIQQKCLIPI